MAVYVHQHKHFLAVICCFRMSRFLKFSVLEVPESWNDEICRVKDII